MKTLHTDNIIIGLSSFIVNEYNNTINEISIEELGTPVVLLVNRLNLLDIPFIAIS